MADGPMKISLVPRGQLEMQQRLVMTPKIALLIPKKQIEKDEAFLKRLRKKAK